MSEWKSYKLGDVCKEISYGYTESARQDKVGPKFIRITDIQYDFINWDNVPYCPISEDNYQKYKLEIGDIVIARTGASTGATAIFKDENIDAVFASYLIRYRVDNQCANPFYISHLLKSSFWKNYVGSIIGGSAQPGANAKQFANFECLLPSLATQQAIASILSSLDDKIELNLQMNQTLETMAQAIFKEWFVEFNFPGFDGELVDGLPKGWRMGSIYELIEVINGFPFKSNMFNKDNEGIGLIRIRDLKNNKAGFFTTEKASVKYLIKAGDILAGMDAEFTPSIWLGEDSWLNQRVCKFNPQKDYVHELFILHTVKPLLEKSQYGIVGTTVIHLGKSDIDRYEILIPDENVLKNVNEIFKPIHQRIIEIEVENRTLTQLRDSLLPKLLTGKISLNL